jgi:hypothetical protein
MERVGQVARANYEQAYWHNDPLGVYPKRHLFLRLNGLRNNPVL